MKFAILFCLSCTLFFACGKDAKPVSTSSARLATTYDFVASPDQDTASYMPLYLHPIPAAENLNSPTTTVGGYGQVLAPPMERFEAQVLTKSIWCFEFYSDSQASIPQKLAGSGQWFQFSPDGTFKAGHWGTQTYSGAWYLDFQGQFPILQLDANVDQMDSKWEIQGIAGDQAAMAWVRPSNSGFGPNRRPISCKLIELTSLPTKQQFAHLLQGL
jgi:hypothetical protein